MSTIKNVALGAYNRVTGAFLNWLVPVDLFENMRFDDEENL